MVSTGRGDRDNRGSGGSWSDGGPGGPRRDGGRGAPRGGRGGRGERRSRRDETEDSGLIEKVVKIRRVSKVVKGGRHLTFNAMVVVGDGAGNVGSGLGKAGAVPDAVRKGTSVARKDMHPIKLRESTIPHEMVAKYGAAKVLLMPAAPGTGIIAGGGVRAVMEAAGVKDVLSKTYGSSNTINIVKATMKALNQMRDPIVESRRRRNFGAPPAPAMSLTVPPRVETPAVAPAPAASPDPTPVVAPAAPASEAAPSAPASEAAPSAPTSEAAPSAPTSEAAPAAPVSEETPSAPAPEETPSAPVLEETPSAPAPEGAPSPQVPTQTSQST